MRAISTVLAGLPLLWLSGCAVDQSCTEIGCEHRADIAYDFAATGPYDLTIGLPGETLQLRCNDPDWPLLDEQPEYVDCDSGGFSIVGDAANTSSITVSVYDVGADEVLAAGELVDLFVPGEAIEPNGPGCPPICFERMGVVLDNQNP